MAYTDGNIDIAAPADGDLMSQGDDEIRKFKRQVRDRLATIVTDTDAEPLKLLGIIVSKQQFTVVGTISYPHGVSTQDFTVAGAEVGDPVLVVITGSAPTFVFLHAWVQTANNVRVTVGNDSDSLAIAFDEEISMIVVKASMYAI